MKLVALVFLATVLVLAAASGQRKAPTQEILLCGNYSSLFMYTMTVSVGTPPLLFDVSFDTGSTDLMIPRSDCDSCVPGRNGALYNPAGSSTSARVSCPAASFKCGNCSESGECQTVVRYVGITEDAVVSIDSVSIVAPQPLAPVKTAFGAITNITMQNMLVKGFGDDDFAYPAGVAGFANRATSAFKGPSLFDQMVQQLGVSDIFSFCLNSWYHDRAVGGALVLGGGMPQYASGPVAYTPLVRQESGFYEINLQDVLVNGKSLGLNPSLYNTKHAIMDSGTPTLSFNAGVYNVLVSAIRSLCSTNNMKGACNVDLAHSIFNGKTCFELDSSDIAQYPQITIILDGGVTLEYPPTQYLIPLYYCNFAATGAGRRVSFAVESDNSGFGTVLGATLLQQYTTTVDRASQRLGFAPVNNCPKPTGCTL